MERKRVSQNKHGNERIQEHPTIKHNLKNVLSTSCQHGKADVIMMMEIPIRHASTNTSLCLFLAIHLSASLSVLIFA